MPWIQATIRSDMGRARQDNQDSVFGVTALMPAPNGTPLPFAFFAVADGMGGLLDGGVASQTAIRQVADYVVRELLLPALDRRPGSSGQLTVAEVLEAALRAANKQIFGVARHAGIRTGTTFSCAVLLGGQLVTAHVGDSRIYLWGPDGLVLLTQDHSLVARLVALGQFTPEEARRSPQRNALYRALGQAEGVEVESATRSWRGAKALLLCTDGLWDLVADDEIANVLDEAPSLEAAAAELIDLANARGGPDNITVILVHLPQAPP
jgi:serine/threonine protein phosphatase PrpC